jgi:hypothetical protein
MAEIKITSLENKVASFDALDVTYRANNLSAPSSSRDTYINKTIGIGANVFDVLYTSPTESQPLVWNPVGFNPDTVEIAAIGFTGIGSGSLRTEDGVSVLSPPQDYTLEAILENKYIVRRSGFDVAYPYSQITLLIIATDTLASISVTRTAFLRYQYATADQ